MHSNIKMLISYIPWKNSPLGKKKLTTEPIIEHGTSLSEGNEFTTESSVRNKVLTNSMTYGTRRFNAAFIRTLQISLSRAESNQFLVLISISLSPL